MLPPVLQDYVDEFDRWSRQDLAAIDVAKRIAGPLYHYTDLGGLKGILERQQIWFTDYRHLNDPKELLFGMDVAARVLRSTGRRHAGMVKLFADMTGDLFQQRNFVGIFHFFIGSFSRARDELGQWRAYANNARGFAIGLSPALFQVFDKPHRQPHENVFVAPVVYGSAKGRASYLPAIQKAAEIVERARYAHEDILRDRSIGMSFLREMANALIACQLIGTSLAVKHPGYRAEREVRLYILGMSDKLQPYVDKRPRNGIEVPFIRSDLPIRAPGSILEIVAGPAAALADKEEARATMRSLSLDPGLLKDSSIPYRVV